MTVWNVIALLGGLAMFIFGMNLMSDGLKLVAGSYLKKVLEKLTQNRVIAMAVGAGLTVLIQSSNAMCVMVVGFVNAGLMELERSVGILMGAKIGTTITGQLIAFNISQIAPLIAFAGVIVTMFAKKQKAKNVGQIIASLGVLFIGLGTMSEAMKPLANEEWFQSILRQFSNPILGVIVGLIFTVVIQSASASVGVLQMMAMSGVMGFHQAFYIMLGMNIGASVAPALASIGGRKDAKRVAMIVILFESIGVILFLIVTQIFPVTLDWIAGTAPTNPSRQIANSNTIFECLTVLILLPFAKPLVRMASWLIPGSDQKDVMSLHYIDESGYQSGTVLIGQIDQEVRRMCDLVRINILACTQVYNGKMEITEEQFADNEAAVDMLNKEITAALIHTSELDITPREARHVSNLYHIVTDLERIGDHAENILGYSVQMKENKQKFSGKALKEMEELSDVVYRIYDTACDHFEEPSREKFAIVYELEEKIDHMVERLRNNNIKRLSKGKCEATQGLYFNEILVDLERVGDHCQNIAKLVKRYPVRKVKEI